MHDIDTVRHEIEGEEEFNYEGEGEGEGESEEESSDLEGEEEFLAAELLGVSSEAEMDQFLGKLFKRISKFKGVGAFLSQHAGPLGDTLKSIAKSALPTIGAALGTAIPIPGVGTALGGMVGNAARQLLEAESDGESESESSEESEYRVARRFVRLAANTARYGARLPAIPNRRAATLRALRSALYQTRNQRRRLAWLRAARRRRAGRRYAPYSYGGPVYVGDGIAPYADDDGDMGGLDTGGLAAGGGDDAGAQTGPGDAARNGSTGGAPSAQGTAGSAGEFGAYESEYGWPIGGTRSGRWVRRGGKIVLYGV